MSIKKTLAIAASLFLGSFFLINCSTTKNVDTDEAIKPLLIYAKGNVYKPEWTKVDSLEQNGLTQSALKEVIIIEQKAKKENNHEQIIKALIVKAKLQANIKEYAFEKTIQELTIEATKADYPLEPLIHSIIADLYWKYYTVNRWKFNNRSVTQDFKNDDITTWDLKKLTQETVKHYQLSIQNIDSLTRTPIETFSEIIIEKNARAYRPYLYDFLAHRAIDFFINEEPNITKPMEEFVMDNPIYLAPFNDFSKVIILTKDSSSLKYFGLIALQNLTINHLNDSNPVALIDIELKRLNFVKNNASFNHSDSLYYKGLTMLYAKLKEEPTASEIVYELAMVHFKLGNLYSPIQNKEGKDDLIKARNLCLNAIGKYPNNIGVQKCKHLISLIELKNLNVQLEKVNTPNKPSKGLIEFKNVDKVYFKLVKMDYDDFYKSASTYGSDERLTKIKNETLLKEWGLDLKNDGDFQKHSGEFKIDPLDLGFYVLITSTNGEFIRENEAVTLTPFWVSNISYLTRKHENEKLEVFVLNRENGDPIQGVKAKVYYEKYNYTFRKYEWKTVTTKMSNTKGVINVIANENYRNYYINFSKGDDQLNTRDAFYLYKDYYNDQKVHLKTVFFTDRAIYRPGQTVHFKGIVLESDNDNNNKIKTNFKSAVSFYDVNHQKVKTLYLTTNEYGTFSGSFIAPNNGLNGQMYISNKYGSLYISVEEYKRPKFEVKFEPIKGSYKLGETVNVVGNAKTYSGAALDEATVNYRVVRNASFPYWCYYRWGYWPQSAQKEIKNGTIKTDDNGDYKIDFIAEPDKSIKKDFSPTYSYTIYADVVDINGETHSSSAYVYVGYKALNINVNISDQLNKNGIDTVDFTTTNLNGELEIVKGNVKIWALKMPKKYYYASLWKKGDKKYIDKETYLKNFPIDEYNNENNKYKWEKNIKVYDHDFNTATRKAIQFFHLPEWESGVYVLEATCKDKFGQEVKEIKYFTVFGDNEKQMPTNDIDWFTALKSNGEPGEKAEFLIGSAAKGVNVLYEIEHKGKIIHQERIKINSEQKKITIPILEKYRGNVQVHFAFVKEGRNYSHSAVITVPHTNKMLDIQFETFRNKLLPGQKEEWKIKIKGKKGEKIAAEMVATLYDASLDAFRPNYWGLNVLYYDYSKMYWQGNTSFNAVGSEILQDHWNIYVNNIQKKYDKLNWFGFNYGSRYYDRYDYDSFGDEVYYNADLISESSVEMEEYEISGNSRGGKGKLRKESGKAAYAYSESDNSPSEDKNKDVTTVSATLRLIDGVKSGENQHQTRNGKDFAAVKARKNFAETAFFYPHLRTNDKGEVIIKFTIPEALTKWKFMGLAHTKDLKTGMLFEETVTQKDLMVYPNAPRFFRENDKMTFSTKIINLSEKDIEGGAKIFFYDALTSKLISKELLNGTETKAFTIRKGKSTSVDWQIAIPEGYSAITYKVVAKAGNFTDGEEMAVPVLTNRMLVTESMPLPIRGNQTKKFKFEKLVNNNSNTFRHHKLTLEFTSNPAWYAIQALPYLMEYPYECAEQTFSRFYANSIASHIANSNPKIKTVFESWKQKNPAAFLSNLEKNQELKSVILEETPWVLNAQNESERKKRVGLLFDLNKMSNELGRAEKKLQQLQVSNGGWTWFKGMPEDRYITQHIVTGMGHLDHLGVKNVRTDYKTWNMVKSAVRYLDNRIREDYERLKKDNWDLEKDNIDYYQIQYLYARSYFLKDVEISSRNKEAYNYYCKQAEKYWLNKSRYMQGMIALALHRNAGPQTGIHTEHKIIASLKENAINHEELGMYWNDNNGGYHWYQAPIETQALLIEAFDEVVDDKVSVEAMKIWLLKQKQTQDWRTTKATTEACYALLLRGTDLLASDQLVEIKVGNKIIDPKKMDDVKVEAGTGYFKTSWSKTEIKPNMGNVTVSKKDDGVAWGAMYWQYFEQLDKITSAETPLKLVKKLFLQKNTPSGPIITPIVEGTKLKPGDKIKVRIELRVDRDMNYVHMKDMRAAGLEPINVFSGYRYQGGLGYYESTKDASTNFFFDHLKKGTYVFEYPLRVNISGDFSNGITSIQSMYAPEFTSHSEGIRLNIVK